MIKEQKERKNEKDDNVVFFKQVPIHSKDRLARATRKKMTITWCLLNKYQCILGIDRRENQRS